MQAIIVDCIPIVDPQLAPVIGDDAETVIASPSDFQAACPTYGKVIASSKTTPFAVCVAIVRHLTRHFMRKQRIGQIAPTSVREAHGCGDSLIRFTEPLSLYSQPVF